MTIRVLQELGIEHVGVPKSVEQFRDREFDLVVTVCDGANEQCPVWLGTGRRLHESFRDPADAVGTDEERLGVFRLIRDQIYQKLPDILV